MNKNKNNKNIVVSINRNQGENKAPVNLTNTPIYASFQARALAMLIDCLLASIILIPFFSLLDQLIYGPVLPGTILNEVADQLTEALKQNANINARDFIFNNPNFKQYFITNHGYIKLILDQLLQVSVLLAIFLCFWCKRGATPGKMFLSLKIVNADTLGDPSRKDLIIRIFGYIVSIVSLLLGVIWIAFDPRKQGWHDKMANTLVIKDTKNKQRKT